MEKVIVILGPTASGKTKISISLSKELNGEIVSADSMQVYRHLDIGTAKPTKDEMSGVIHHMIDIMEPNEKNSVATYKKEAIKCIDNIIANSKLPIIVGGTGLYINSLVSNIDFSESTIDTDLRERLKEEALAFGNEYIHQKLKKIDPISAERIHPNDIKRIIRAIEVYKHTNKTMAQHQEISKKILPKYDFKLIGLTMDRERLYERINIRVDEMLRNGLVSEVRKLLNEGFSRESTAMQAIGYKEIVSYLDGGVSLEDAIFSIKRESRRYAKRQLTWFRRMENVFWIDVDQYNEEKEILKIIKYFIAT